jgi:REP element-mobilizing transposase RayT
MMKPGLGRKPLPRSRARPRHAQLSLLYRGRRGGPRPGAGRPKAKTAGVPHLTRDRLTRNEAAHVTWRVVRNVPSLRASRRYATIEAAMRAGKEKRHVGPQRGHFRVVAFSIQRDHIHLIAEAGDRFALARGLQGLGVRLARRMNRQLRRHGRFFRDRYHARVLRTPREVRNAIVYVLNNRLKHLRQRGERLPSAGWCDPCSSAVWFDGWSSAPRASADAPARAAPVAACGTWLLRVGWRRHGLIRPGEMPADSRTAPRLRGARGS